MHDYKLQQYRVWDTNTNLTKIMINPSLSRSPRLCLPNFLFLASTTQLTVLLAVLGRGLMAVNLRQIGDDISVV